MRRLSLVAAVLGAALGCAHNANLRGKRVSAPPTWIEAPLTGEVEGDLKRLAALAEKGPEGRVVRLDRLMDLFDAARFAEDEYARETFWEALGGHQVGVGDEATREAIRRMLDEALALEDKPEDADDVDFVVDAIHLLTNDMQQPATADDVSIRNLAYRELVDHGHPRVADNARWRLYDHARGTLVGATQSSPEDRIDVAVQALYTTRESVADLLADTSAHGRPAPPTPEELWALVGVHRVALAKDARWKAVIAVRDGDDNALRQTLMSMLPAPRDLSWRMPTLPRGTASAESLAPVVEVYAGKALVDAGRPGARPVLLRDEVEELARTIQSAIAADGRGAVLFAADPMLPAPELHTVLRGLRRAQVSWLELAAKEPRVEGDGEVVVALPVFVARSSDATPGVRALLQARIAVHATGRGPIVFVDGRGLDTIANGPRELATQLDAVKLAYPRERIVRLTVANDLQYGQLVDLVAALVGGPEPRFGRVGWWAGGGPDPGEQARANDGLLALRASLSRPQPKVDLDQPYPLKEDDQKRLEAFTTSLAACLPELEDKRARAGMRVELRFAEGKMQRAALLKPKPRRGFPGANFSDCIDEQAFGLRLRHHQDKFVVKVSIE